MNFGEFAKELHIEGRVLSIKRMNDVMPENPISSGCALRVLNHVMAGETVRLTLDSLSCNGGKSGFGFDDGLMKLPGGYGHFVSYGSDEENAPAGMRLKCDPELAERGALAAPKGVMDGFSAIEIKPYEEGDEPDLVTVFATPDQLAALNLLFGFRRIGDDLIFFPAGSGCYSIFRLPFAELLKAQPRAVIGNADISSRVYFDANSLFFTVSGPAFRQMLEDSGESFLIANAWKGIKKRL